MTFSIAPIGSLHRHKSGAVYTVIAHLNVENTKPDYPQTVAYRNVDNGKEYCRRLDDWARSFVPVSMRDLYSQLATARNDALEEAIARIKPLLMMHVGSREEYEIEDAIRALKTPAPFAGDGESE